MMSVYTGKPGAGKSYGALRALVAELRFGHRSVVTNLSVIPCELHFYFSSRWPDVDVLGRLRLITREETCEFWRFRPNLTVLPLAHQRKLPGADKTSDTADVEVLSQTDSHSTLYIIDEAHVAFDSRKWAKSATALTFYNSQHRKLDDEAIYVTQFLKLIESRVRNFCEYFHLFRNFAGVRLMNFFAMPKRMRELVYCVEPAPGVAPDVEKWVALDPALAKTYDTTGGVGISGGRRAEKREVRGFHISVWWLFAGLALAGVAVKAAVYWIPRWVIQTKAVPGLRAAPRSEGIPSVVDAAPRSGGVSTGGPSRLDDPERARTDARVSAQSAPSKPSGGNQRADGIREPLRVTGYMHSASRSVATLSDGTVAVGSEIQAVTPYYVVLQGRRVWFAPITRPPSRNALPPEAGAPPGAPQARR